MKFPINGDELYEWWLKYSKKEERKINETPEFTRRLIDDFFSNSSKIRRLEQHYKGINKYPPKDADTLFKIWQTIKVKQEK